MTHYQKQNGSAAPLSSPVNTSHFSIDARALKATAALHALEICQRLYPHGRRVGNNFLAGSIEGEPGSSFSVCVAGDKAGVYRDFATGEGGGNLIDLVCRKLGYTFAEACKIVREWVGLPSLSSTRHPGSRPARPAEITPKPPDSKAYRPTDAEVAQGTQMAERLIGNLPACKSIARRRGWQHQTVLNLAHEASLGLSENNRLIFLYDTSAKERWRDGNGERRLRFLFGKADALWRGGLLPVFGKVFVTEGETDAISLVDAGAEQDGDTLVVALPSASTIKPCWGLSLARKKVVLCLDADPDGQAATVKLKALLAPHVARLRTVNLEEVLR